MLRSGLLLILTAIIWGLAFVAQRAGMEFIGPFTFNGIRFALGALSLIPVTFIFQRQRKVVIHHPVNWTAGLWTGTVLFIAASFQQIGIVHTTAGNAGFITTLYVIFVPILGIFLKHHIGSKVWAGAILATIGLFLISVNHNLILAPGDGLVLISAIFFAIHVLLLGYYSPKTNALALSIIQFSVCSLLSLAMAAIKETIVVSEILHASLPVLYGGIISVGVAYTLQVIAQAKVKPANAAIILSFESVFAVIGGWLILGENITARGMAGCLLMLAGIVISQMKTTNGKIHTIGQN